MKVVLGNRDARNLVTVGLEAARAAHADPKDPRYIPDQGGVDADAGVALLSTPLAGKTATVVEVPDDVPLVEALTTITHPSGVWARNVHDAAARPAWVAGDSPALVAALAEHYGCPVRELEG